MGKKNKDSLGRALIKDRFAKNRHRRHVEDNTMLHTTEINDGYEWGRLNLQSVTAESSLQEFLSTAELANREFIAEKLNVKYVKSAPCEVEIVTSQPDFDEPLTVPRRPSWKPGITAEEQLTRERDAFLDWRRHLNELQEKLGAAVTPYERNLELWKQLWRTLEKSDIVLILLDARNPLLFRCSDLERYAAEQKCKCILLLNKADLTTEYVRKCWADYFNKEMRAHEAAMARLCELVGRHTFAKKYGLLLPEYEGSELEYKKILTAHAFNRGFMTAAGQPDQSRSARLFLKDAANGRLQWEQLPPGYEPAPVDQLIEEKKNETRKPTPRESRAVEGWLNKSTEIDNTFFAMKKSTAHVQGKPVLGITRETNAQVAGNSVIGKPWKQEKKHANKKKREKLRRVYAHLDEH
ncbi:jg15808 [Pararge aegeria aegeria]|uniref:Jg15808 protein n=1 Tax=Pararge aegeria aegeria TaxID=348720 RepID=A0A8S4S6X8_9NEOP|nr:jg15808 [Pararge aegeria aegeria]